METEYTVEQAAIILNKTTRSIYNMIKQGKLKGAYQPTGSGGRWAIPESALRPYISDRMNDVTSAYLGLLGELFRKKEMAEARYARQLSYLQDNNNPSLGILESIAQERGELAGINSAIEVTFSWFSQFRFNANDHMNEKIKRCNDLLGENRVQKGIGWDLAAIWELAKAYQNGTITRVQLIEILEANGWREYFEKMTGITL